MSEASAHPCIQLSLASHIFGGLRHLLAQLDHQLPSQKPSMDPLSALSVAAAVVQFLDFSGTIVTSTYKIYKSTSKKNEGNDTITSITAQLVDLTSELERSATVSPVSKVDQEIIILCQQCKKTADNLLDALKQLNAGSGVTLWDSFKIALRSVWSQGEIDALQGRLDSYRQQISMHILVALRHVDTWNALLCMC